MAAGLLPTYTQPWPEVRHREAANSRLHPRGAVAGRLCNLVRPVPTASVGGGWPRVS